MSTPATNIYLCSGVPLNNRYDHTFFFHSASNQLSYFNSKVVRTLTDYSYVRKTWNLKVAATMEDARVWSYLFFRNGTGKRYFYFINQIEYINDNAVELSLELDVMQTYMFDWTIRPCYVEREHSVNDVWGENTVDEGLEVGDLITANREAVDLSSNMAVMIASTFDIIDYYIKAGTTEKPRYGWIYDNIYSGYQISICPRFDSENGALWENISEVINYLDSKGKSDAIVTMWLYPENLVVMNTGEFDYFPIRYAVQSAHLTHTAFDRPTTIDGYKPKNQKVLQYPYCFMYVTNNNGGAAVYHYEKFGTDNRTFSIQGNIAPDAMVRLIPVDYKGVSHNYDESLTLSNFPMCAWSNDLYKLWLAQNQNQQNLGFAMGALKIVGGVATAVASSGVGTAAGVGLIASGAADIAGQLAQRADKEIQPPQSRGSATGSHNVSRGLHKFDFYHKTIDAYHAEMIDNYFSMYGYATRKVKVPNVDSRPSWNYVKTVGSNVTGNFAVEDLNRINAIFDRGVTFWHVADVGNYSLNNQP